jgi:hypothetical protein
MWEKRGIANRALVGLVTLSRGADALQTQRHMRGVVGVAAALRCFAAAATSHTRFGASDLQCSIVSVADFEKNGFVVHVVENVGSERDALALRLGNVGFNL